MQKDNNTDKDQGHDVYEQDVHDQHDVSGQHYDDSFEHGEEPARGGILVFIRDKIGFGYLIFGILIAVIVFLGARNKIMDYFGVGPRATARMKASQAAKLDASTAAGPMIGANAGEKSANKSSEGNSRGNAFEPAESQANVVMPATAATEVQGNIPADVQGGSAMSPQALQAAIKDYIENNPEVLVSSLTKFQQKMQEQRAQGAKEFISKASDTIATDKPYLGNKNGRIVITEFFDYRCGFCKRVYPDLVRLMKENSEVKIALVELPFAGEESLRAVKFSLAVSALYPAKFYDFHTALLNTSSIDDKFIFGLISQYGMDRAKVVEMANSSQIAALIDANRQLAENVGVQGVPSFIINGEFVAGALSFGEMKKKVDAIKLPAAPMVPAAGTAPAVAPMAGAPATGVVNAAPVALVQAPTVGPNAPAAGGNAGMAQAQMAAENAAASAQAPTPAAQAAATAPAAAPMAAAPAATAPTKALVNS